MRIYTTKYFSDNGMSLLHRLSDSHTMVDEYRKAFYELGKILGKALNEETYDEYGSTMLACASEDADWLASGILDVISQKKVSLAVFWNERIKLSNDSEIEVSPIVKSYIEPISSCQTLVLVKSIISTSCVVKTQLTRLVNYINPEKIYIVAPVMFKNAEGCLKKEFPNYISDKFVFITLAKDDRRDDNGVILPGIGGMVYPRLGLGDQQAKNKYIPDLVKKRIG